MSLVDSSLQEIKYRQVIALHRFILGDIADGGPQVGHSGIISFLT
jgi:hypothetical protein